MNDKTVGVLLVVSIIVFFFVSYNAYNVHEIAKYCVIVFGLYGSFKLIG